MCLMALAGINALAFEYVTQDTVPAWDTAAMTPPAAKLAAAVSLCLWTIIVLAGRLIPYGATWFPPAT